METSPLAWVEAFGWLEQTAFADAVRTVPSLYPFLMGVHVLGIVLMVGSAFIVDLRLLGVGRDAMLVSVVTRYLLPLSHLGFAVVLVTGATMFPAVALQAGTSAAALWKLGLIVLAGLNILTFHSGVYRSVACWDLSAPTPWRAKLAAGVSITSWTGAIFAGRFLAY